MKTIIERQREAMFSLVAVPKSANEETRSVTGRLATSTPSMIREDDDDPKSAIMEYLAMDEVEWPASRQVPLLDTHKRDSLKDQIGSIRNLRLEDDPDVGRCVVGDLHLDDSDLGLNAWRKLRDGHLTDISVGYAYALDDVEKLADGDEADLGGGQRAAGPCIIVRRWRVREGSLVPIGADPNAKLRGAKSTIMEDKEKKDKTGAASKNPPATAVTLDVEKIRADARKEALAEGKKLGAKEERERSEALRKRNLAIKRAADGAERMIGGDSKAKSELKELVNKLTAETTTTSTKARAEIMRFLEKAKPMPRPHIQATRDEGETIATAMADAMVEKGLGGVRTDTDGKARTLKLHDARLQFRGYSLRQLLEEMVERSGKPVRGRQIEDLLRDSAISAAEAGHRGVPDRDWVHGRSAAMHGPAHFPIVLQNALNKLSLAGFTEANFAWREFCKVLTANDMRVHKLIKRGQSRSFVRVNDHGEVPMISLPDGKQEEITPSDWAIRWALTDKAFINDDMGALAQPYEYGNAAARTIHELVVYRLLSNSGAGPTMVEDNVAMFHATHGNLIASGSGAVPSFTTLNAAYAAMMVQRGAGAGKPLNLSPAIIYAPPSLRGTVLQLLNSEWVPGATNETRNPYHNALRPVFDAYLSLGATVSLETGDATATGNATRWFLFTDPGVFETMCVAFYGSETPEFVSERPLDVLGTEYRANLRFDAAPADYRGAFQNFGA